MGSRILVVDDDPFLLAEISKALVRAGHFVTTTNNGGDALCLLATKPPPDLVLLDIKMPGWDGFTVLKHLGPTAPPVIVMSGSDLGDVDFQTDRVQRMIVKPFNLPKLLNAVNGILTGAQDIPNGGDDEPITPPPRPRA